MNDREYISNLIEKHLIHLKKFIENFDITSDEYKIFESYIIDLAFLSSKKMS